MSVPVGFVSFAQHGEDVILWRALGHRGRCFYVDVGAFDPSYDSVTRALYERGWRGINIEPQADRLAAFEEARPEDINLSLAIGDRDGTVTLRVPPTPGWATIVEGSQIGNPDDAVRTFEVPIRRLDTLLPELGITHVDVLKIDVEGAEPAVVRGLLGGPTRPLVCVVEGVAPGVGRAAGNEAVSLLIEAGYTHCLFDGINHYLTTERALEPALSVPANPLDEYSREAMADLDRERSQLIATISTLAAENLGLRGRAAAMAQNAGPLRRPMPSDPDSVPLRVVAETPRGDLGSRALDPATRARRRRMTFQRRVRVEQAPLNRSPAAPDLLSLAVTDLPPLEAVDLLYLSILGREPDPEGLVAWANRLDGGDPLPVLARELAESPEAMARPVRDRARVHSDLVAWESISTLKELGVSGGNRGHAYTPGRVRHQILVEALFEVALQRRPAPEEVRFETDKLIAGYGRQWLIRSYAVRPEVKGRFLGIPTPGLRGRLSRWRNGRRYLENFRDLVVAAEARQVNHLLAQLTVVEATRLSGVPGSTRVTDEG